MIRTILLEPLFNILLFLYAVIPGGDFGIAIIILTVIIRLLMWPLVKKQLHHQKAMRDLQPELAKLKKKAKGDKQKESQFMMELFKEKRINPFASLGLALLQFPILIALFFVLRDVVVAANIPEIAYGFVHRLPAIREIIANPEAFDPTLFGVFHMADPSIILALVAGLAQYAQAKQLAPQNLLGGDKAKKTGFNITLILPVITVAVATQFPSALALYWAMSSAVAVAQQHVVLSEDVGFMRRLAARRKKETGNSKAAAAKAPKPGGKRTGKNTSRKPRPAKKRTSRERT